MFYILQTNQHDCGFTTIKMMLANINKDHNYLFIDSPFKDEEGVSLFDLVEEASTYGLHLTPCRANEKMSLCRRDKVPFIAIMDIEGRNHAVYVYKLTKKEVYYYDPAYGKRKEKYMEFINHWTGDLLRLSSFRKQKAPRDKIQLIKPKERVLSFVISLISGICGILGVYYISKDSFIYLPVIFFSVMLISEVLLKKYHVILMSKMDDRIKGTYQDIKGKQYYQFHQLFEQYKGLSLISNITLFSNVLAVILVIVILLINERLNFIYIGINVVLAFIYYALATPMLTRREDNIIDLETKIKRAEDINSAEQVMTKARNLSYVFADISNGINYLIIAIQLLTAFSVMNYLHIVNVTYIICYLMIEIYLYQNLTSALSYKKKMDKQDNVKVKLYSLMIKK